MADPILPLGDPRLRRVCTAVPAVLDPEILEEIRRVKGALAAFRAERGFGRGLAAPQLGIPRRIVALDLGQGPRVLLDPVLTWRSPETFTLWDDCMCFPDLLVKVRRHRSVSLAARDEAGRPLVLERVGQAESELLQHELDHLDGILAVDRALDEDWSALRFRPVDRIRTLARRSALSAEGKARVAGRSR